MQELGKALSDASLKGSTFVVAGHTDAIGGEAYNQDLSERRADTIKKYLTEKYGIAGTNLKWERRRTAIALAGYAAVGLLTVGTVVAWSTSYINNRRYISEVSGRVEEVRKLVQATPNRASPELQPIVPALDATRTLAITGRNSDEVPWSLGFGLYQGRKLDGAARTAYERMLVDAVLPRLALRIEEQLRQGGDAPEMQYEALKAYLMLHDPDHFDAESLKTTSKPTGMRSSAASWPSKTASSCRATSTPCWRRAQPCRRCRKTRPWSSSTAPAWPR